MPNITEFDAGNLTIRPSETGVEAAAAAGRRIGAFYNQQAEGVTRAGSEIGRGIANTEAYFDHQQINAGADHGANLFASLTDSWNKTSAGADPHDPTVAQKWRTQVLEPALDQFSQGFTTEKAQDWANSYVNRLRQHYYEKTEADMSTLAGVAVHQSVTNAVTKFSNTAVSDPSSVDTSIGLFRQNLSDVIAANPNLKGADAAKVREEIGEEGVRKIVQAGAMGSILNSGNPEAAAAAWAKKYPDYVSGAEELQLAKAAKVQSRANLAYSKQAEAYQRMIDNSNVEAARNQIWSKYVTTDAATGQPHIDPQFFKDAVQIPAKYPNAPNATETARTLLDWGERQQKPEKAVSDPAVTSDLSSRVLDQDNPTTVIQTMRAEADGKITHQEGNQMRSLIELRDKMPNDPMFKYAVDGAKAAIEGTTNGEKALAAGKFPAFMQSFMQEYLKERNAGTLKPNALDLNDETSLINQMIKPFSIENNIGGFIKQNGGVGAPPPKSGGYVIPGQT